MRLAIYSIVVLLAATFLAQAQTGRDLATDRRVLAGTDWRLVSLGPAGGESTVINGTTVTIKFGEDGRVGGSTGCNSYGGSYEVRGNNVTFGRMISTRRACLDQRANQQEQQFLGALESANRFRLTNDRLAIFYNGGRNVLNFANNAPPSSDNGADADQLDDPLAALSAYYEAINARDYRRAWRMWETPITPLDQFTRGFADTDRVRLLIEPPLHIEGAAGSSYAEIPVLVLARTRSGGERVFGGCYTMRKSNVPDEERPGEAGWRIYRANLSQVSANVRLTSALRSCR